MRNPIARSIVFLTLLLPSGIRDGAAASAATLTFEDRVAAQTAIERVFWEHRIWPKDNPQSKPPLEQVMPESAIRASVEDYLRKSSALERFWGRPITGAQLEDEMARMASRTRDPGMLQELHRALGNDPRLIAECLARPALAERLLQSWYAHDVRIHGDLRLRIEAEMGSDPDLQRMKTLSGRYLETTWKRQPAPGTVEASDVVSLDGEEWDSMVGRLGASGIQENADSFSVVAVTDRGKDFVRTAAVTWPKKPIETWLDEQGIGIDPSIPEASYEVMSTLGGCTQDTWTTTYEDVPDPRSNLAAVWTGSEMIIWGGAGPFSGSSQATGGRYTPGTDTWIPTSRVNAPVARSYHAAVWTGTEMVVWGGLADGQTTPGTGGRYNPTSDTWTATSTVNAPGGRSGPTAVWTGSTMIVWGGSTSAGLNTGGRYDPSSDTWTPTTTTNAPIGRSYHTAVWSGSEMIVWGGSLGFAHANTGGRYNPIADTWTPTSTVGAPSARFAHVAVWAGTEMIVVGSSSNPGGRYSPGSDSWTAISMAWVPQSATAVWTGSEMIVWGGAIDGTSTTFGGARYVPATNTTTSPTTSGAPAPRAYHVAVWTGSEMILWGGWGSSGGSSWVLNSGGRYSPAGNSWIPTGTGTALVGRIQTTAVWTGAEMIVWGGSYRDSGTHYVNTGGEYTPATDSWTETSRPLGVPTARDTHTAVWTGTEMIVWGGYSGVTTGTGGRYSPAANTWIPTGMTAAPQSRRLHYAVWTGSEMIVWGGLDASDLTSGGRYAPLTDTWTPMSTAGAPLFIAGIPGDAVWTGSRMVVWGRTNLASGAAGARYDPAMDTWATVSTVGQPNSPAAGQKPVWTGTEMIVWSGFSTPPGGRYNPVTDVWTPVTTTGSPGGRSNYPAVWTGIEMLLWGGYPCTGSCEPVDTGARYNPTTDTWTTMNVALAPSGRARHVAVWTGDEMVVWGGTTGLANPVGGGRYCACATPQTFYRDTDGDGFGATSVVGCAGTPPAGYSLTGGDCDDTRAAVYPGAPQLCDGLQNDCGAPSWPTMPANEADADGDGSRICAGDCNDANPTVRPGAPQLCDGINNDCNDPTWPTVSASEIDSDGDGYRPCAGDCNDANPAVRPSAAEVCNGIDDNCDSQIDEDAQGVDSDGDGVRNACDNCRFSPNASQLDTDGDHVGNACDNCFNVPNADQTDTDADGRGNVCDNCPVNANATQDDLDADFVGDTCDNCPFDANTSQADTDQDGDGDLCDLNDGLIWEFREDKVSVSWQPEQGPTSWNVYIGDLGVLKSTGVYTQLPGGLADRHCGETGLSADELSQPATGQVSFSLVTGVQGGVEGSLGNSSTGPRPNANPCPP